MPQTAHEHNTNINLIPPMRSKLLNGEQGHALMTKAPGKLPWSFYDCEL